MTHSHEYAFWHTHLHNHAYRELPEGAFEGHDTGHYHLYAQTHDHGDGNKVPHSHKEKQAHPEEDGITVHHHGLADHVVDKAP